MSVDPPPPAACEDRLRQGEPFLGGAQAPEALGLSDPESPEAAEPPPFFWHPAHPANRVKANRPHDCPIFWLILYLSGRPALDSIQTYRLVPSGRACHYLVSGAGEIVQMLPDTDWSPVTGNRKVDQRSIAIEIELENGQPATEHALTATGQLIQKLALRYGIPLDRSQILGAHEVVGTQIQQAPPFDWDQLMARVIRIAPIVADATMPDRFFVSKNWTRTATGSQRRGRFIAMAPTGPSADGAQYRVTFPQTGLYEVAIWYPASPSACAATPLLLQTMRGQVQIKIDQRQGGGAWQTLGQFPFQAGDYWAASISRASPIGGFVIADSIRFQLVKPLK
jgi:hypothetical protein